MRALNEVVRLLDRVADGDLGIAIRARATTRWRLFGAFERMKGGLTRTVRQVLSSSDSVNVGARQIGPAISTCRRAPSSSRPRSSRRPRACRTERHRHAHAESARTRVSLAGERRQLATRGGEMVRGVVSTMNG
ncbi:methyl-accepting chemotaxis protein, partial [Burkholderia plantarii]|nr:methyl-accepting chemotaxis protein [Burkholderia plantarii]